MYKQASRRHPVAKVMKYPHKLQKCVKKSPLPALQGKKECKYFSIS